VRRESMPNALVHLLGGALVAICLVALLPASIEIKVGCGVLALLSSLLPDIDHPKGTARKVYRVVGIGVGSILVFLLLAHMGIIIALLGGIIGGIALVLASEMLIPGHRGVVHSWLFALFITVFGFVLLSMLGIKEAVILALSILAGYASHLILDKIL